MKKKELANKVRLYLKRAKSDNLVKNYPIDKVGYWRIEEGSRGEGREYMKKIIHGQFIDAVAYAVMQPKFYADWCSTDDPDNINHGRVELIRVIELKDSKLTEIL